MGIYDSTPMNKYPKVHIYSGLFGSDICTPLASCGRLELVLI